MPFKQVISSAVTGSFLMFEEMMPAQSALSEKDATTLATWILASAK